MNKEAILNVCQEIYKTEDGETLQFLEKFFQVVFTGEFDRDWIEIELRMDFENISAVDIYEVFISMFEFTYEEDGNIHITNKLVKDMFELALSLNIYCEFSYNFYYFLNEARDFLLLKIEMGQIYFEGFYYFGEQNLITSEVVNFLKNNYQNYEIESTNSLYVVVEALQNEFMMLDQSNILVNCWILIENNILMNGLNKLISKYRYVLDPITQNMVAPNIIKYSPFIDEKYQSISINRLKLINENNKFIWQLDDKYDRHGFFYKI